MNAVNLTQKGYCLYTINLCCEWNWSPWRYRRTSHQWHYTMARKRESWLYTVLPCVSESRLRSPCSVWSLFRFLFVSWSWSRMTAEVFRRCHEPKCVALCIELLQCKPTYWFSQANYLTNMTYLFKGSARVCYILRWSRLESFVNGYTGRGLEVPTRTCNVCRSLLPDVFLWPWLDSCKIAVS